MNITYRRVCKEDMKITIDLINKVIDGLENKEFFIPFSEEGLINIFDEKNAIIYGAYDKEKIVGIGILYINERYVAEIKEILNLDKRKVAELGGYMVLSEYRGQGIMCKLQDLLIKEAKDRIFEYIVATAHPNNIPSNKVLSKSGLKVKDVFTFEKEANKYLRNVYAKEMV